MQRLSTTDSAYLSSVEAILDQASELLVVVRRVYGAGAKDFAILRDVQDFHDLVSGLRQRDSVILVKSFKKVLEGTVDDALTRQGFERYANGASWLLIGEDHHEHAAGWAHVESMAELREELGDRIGNHVCIVEEPDYFSNEHSVGAYVPDDDGIVRPGAY